MGASRRILIVTDLWSTHPNGPATAIRNLRRELEALGHAVELLEPSQLFSISFPLYPEVRLPLFAYFTVRRRILSGRYGDIHLATEGLLGVFARRVCLKYRIPFTTAMHGRTDLYAKVWLGDWAANMWRAHLARFHRPAPCTLVLTRELERFARSIGIERAVLWQMGVDPLFFGNGTCPVALAKPVFLYFGRLSSEKSVEEFLELDLAGTKLVIGGGPDYLKLTARYRGVHFVGYQTGQALLGYLACADAFIFPSRTDVFPQVVVEALAAGVPVAAYDVPGPREFVKNGINGYLSDDLAEAAGKCLALSRAACRESVRGFNWRASAVRFLDHAAAARRSPEPVHGTNRKEVYVGEGEEYKQHPSREDPISA